MVAGCAFGLSRYQEKGYVVTRRRFSAEANHCREDELRDREGGDLQRNDILQSQH